MLVCDNLYFTHSGKEILKDVSFRLANGQNLLIIGENGAGKSTLAKLLCGLLKGKGQISLFGRSLFGIPAKERCKLINYIPPKLDSYDENLTVMDYLLMGYFGHKKKFEPYLDSEKKMALELLCKFDFDSLSNKNLCTLSSGEKQTVMILQAALQKSALTIFDEPVANIDTAKTQILFSMLRSNELFGQKIVITHDLHFAFSLGFDILYLREGKVEFFGSSEEFFATAELERRFGNNVQRCELGVVANYAKQ